MAHEFTAIDRCAWFVALRARLDVRGFPSSRLLRSWVLPMTGWRALTLKQPWPWAVCHRGMDVVSRSAPVPPKLLVRPCGGCRSWMAEFGEPTECAEPKPLRVMIHAGLGFDFAGWGSLPEPVGQSYQHAGVQPKGALVAVATITGSHPGDACHIECDTDCCYGGEIWTDSANCYSCPDCDGVGATDNCSHWAEFPGWDVHHWQIADVTVLAEPVPAKGRPNLWTPDNKIIEAVEAQL